MVFEKVMAGIESDALRANLEETAGEVVIPPELQVLLDIVRRFKGIQSSLESLLYEICHPYRNWELIIPLYRSFVLRNSNHFLGHEEGELAVRLFAEIFFEAINDSKKNTSLLPQIIEAKLAWIEKMINLLDIDGLLRYEPVFNLIFVRMQRLEDGESPIMLHIVQGQHPMKRLASLLYTKLQKTESGFDVVPITALMRLVLLKNYGYWLTADDPMCWFLQRSGMGKHDFQAEQLFSPISHQTIAEYKKRLEDINIENDPLHGLSEVLALPAHVDIVRLYKAIPSKLAEVAGNNVLQQTAGDEKKQLAENWKLLFLFKIMDTEGLYLIHEESLREINRNLVQLIRQQSFEEIEEFLITTFQLLKANVNKYPHTSLQCIQVLGGEVFNRGNSRMVEAFLFSVVRFGFQYANVIGVDEDWQPLTNPAI